MSTPIPALDLDRFVKEDLFTLLGMQNISKEEKLALARDLTQVIYARVYAAAIKSLSIEDRDQAASMLPEEMIPFFAEHDIDLAEMLIEESLSYRAELAQLMLGIQASQIPFGNPAY